MMKKQFIFQKIIFLFCLILLNSCNGIAQEKKSKNDQMTQEVNHTNNPYYSRTDTSALHVSDQEWKKILPPELYAVAREKATERAFTGKYYETDIKGDYYCAVCGNHLFKSTAKFASSCGWPSFFESISPSSVKYEDDNSHGMHRTEVLCGRCGSHLGHIFDDGPPPTYKRFCMNSVSLDFEPAQ